MNERTARFLCCVALQAPGMEQTILHATCEGRVVLEPRGGGGGGGGGQRPRLLPPHPRVHHGRTHRSAE
ncbi:MAG: non-canonical purine NTP pyrophosphatase, partial [Fimbriimonadaceae bacterium]